MHANETITRHQKMVDQYPNNGFCGHELHDANFPDDPGAIEGGSCG